MTSASEKPARRLPGEEGVWVFIIGDLIVFSLMFGVFMYYRTQSPEVFASSQLNLRQDLALANTVLLLGSSWLVAVGLDALRNANLAKAKLVYRGAALCGLAFVALKYVEYSEKFGGGITILTNDFYTYYFVLTGIHLLHLIVGLAVLAFILSIAAKPKLEDRDLRNAESGSLYWHMVDLLWIVILAIIYLI